MDIKLVKYTKRNKSQINAILSEQATHVNDLKDYVKSSTISNNLLTCINKITKINLNRIKIALAKIDKKTINNYIEIIENLLEEHNGFIENFINDKTCKSKPDNNLIVAKFNEVVSGLIMISRDKSTICFPVVDDDDNYSPIGSYVFMQGIFSTPCYFLSRHIFKKLDRISDHLIGSVMEYAIQKRIDIILVNPLPRMSDILVEHYGFDYFPDDTIMSCSNDKNCTYDIRAPTPIFYKFINDDMLYDRSLYLGYEYDDMDRRILRYPKGYLKSWL